MTSFNPKNIGLTSPILLYTSHFQLFKSFVRANNPFMHAYETFVQADKSFLQTYSSLFVRTKDLFIRTELLFMRTKLSCICSAFRSRVQNPVHTYESSVGGDKSFVNPIFKTIILTKTFLNYEKRFIYSQVG